MPAFSRARRESSGTAAIVAYVCAVLSAFIVPSLILSMGLLACLLTTGLESKVAFGNHLTISLPESLLQRTALEQLLVIVGVGTLLGMAYVITLWIFYKQVFHRAQMGIRQIHHDVLLRCIEHAASEGVTAQRARTTQLLEKSLPLVRQGLVAWYRAVPRRWLILASCLSLAMLINIWITGLAMICWYLLWKFYRWIEGLDEPQSSEWELPTSRSRLLEMVQDAPLMARLQPGEGFDTLYRGQLEHVMKLQDQHDQKTMRRQPFILLAATLVISLLTAGVGINVLDPNAHLTLGGSIALTLALLGAGVTALRLTRTQTQLQHVNEAASVVFSFLDQPTRKPTSESLTLGGLRHHIEFDAVSLQDNNGQRLVDDLSLKLQPGSMVALMGAETTTLRTIVELLMGFGRPDSGKVTVDGMVIADVHPGTLSQQLVWVGRDGPVWGGTVEENLRGNSTTVTTADMAEAAREVGIYDLIQSWDEGFTTHLSADDGRLDTRTRYGIAVARARLARPAVVVVDEPELKAGGEDPCFQVLKSLVKDGALVVMLASSVQTLQSSDRVMLIRNGKLETEGKHDEMLGTNDFYRHLNYQLFNPYRDS